MKKFKFAFIWALFFTGAEIIAKTKVVKFSNHTLAPIQILPREGATYKTIPAQKINALGKPKPGIAHLTVNKKSVLLRNHKGTGLVKIKLDPEYELKDWATCEIHATNRVGIKRNIMLHPGKFSQWQKLPPHSKKIKNLTGKTISVQDFYEKKPIFLKNGETKTISKTTGTLLINNIKPLSLPIGNLFEIYPAGGGFAARLNGNWATRTKMYIKNSNSGTEDLQVQPISFDGSLGKWTIIEPGKFFELDLANVKQINARFGKISQTITSSALFPDTLLEIGLPSPYAYRHYIKKRPNKYEPTSFHSAYRPDWQ